MGWQQTHKQQSREKILSAAGVLFTRQGFDSTGIDEVMAAAGMTRGAFYHHFTSKSELYAEAMSHSVKTRLIKHAYRDQNSDTWDLQKLVQNYLSSAHVNGEDGGCPLAFLVSDMSQRDASVRATYTDLLKGLIDGIHTHTGEDTTAVLQKMVMLVGGAAIARAVSDSELQQAILMACRESLQEPEICK